MKKIILSLAVIVAFVCFIGYTASTTKVYSKGNGGLPVTVLIDDNSDGHPDRAMVYGWATRGVRVAYERKLTADMIKFWYSS